MAYLEWITKESFLDYYLTPKGSDFTYHEDFIYQLVNDAVDAIVEADLYDPYIALINIENYRGKLPMNFETAIQVLYRPTNHPSSKKNDKFYRSHITQWTKNLFGSQDCELVTNLVCPTCHEPENCECKTSIIKLASAEAELRFPEIVANLTRASRVVSTNPESPFYVHFHKCHKSWQWIRPASNHFFNHTYHIGDCINFGIETDVEYRIDRPYIQVNDPFCQVLMACLLKRSDDQGYRLIPNVPIVLRLLTVWVDAETMRQKYMSTMDPAYERAWRNFEQQRLTLIGTARNEINAVESDEQDVFIQNIWRKWINPVDNMKNLGRLVPEKYIFRRG